MTLAAREEGGMGRWARRSTDVGSSSERERGRFPLRLRGGRFRRGGGEMTGEPSGRQRAHTFDGARLLEQMGGPGDDLQLAGASQQRTGLSIQPKHDQIIAPDDQKRGRTDLDEPGGGQVGPPTPRHDRPDLASEFCRGDERRSGPRCSFHRPGRGAPPDGGAPKAVPTRLRGRTHGRDDAPRRPGMDEP